MKAAPLHNLRVLAIDPSPRGFGFVVLEGTDRLIDWGMKSTQNANNEKCLKRVVGLFLQFCPDVFVIEDYNTSSCRKHRRVKALLQDAEKLAVIRNIFVYRITQADVKKVFSRYGALSKNEIAIEITKDFPEFEPYLPRRREPWMSEDARMSIFDAAALAFAIFHQDEGKSGIS